MSTYVAVSEHLSAVARVQHKLWEMDESDHVGSDYALQAELSKQLKSIAGRTDELATRIKLLGPKAVDKAVFATVSAARKEPAEFFAARNRMLSAMGSVVSGSK